MINSLRKYQYRRVFYIKLLLLFFVLQTGCQKFLDEKPEKSAVIPTTLTDLQKLLDNNIAMNGNSPAALAELVADNYYILASFWNTQANSSNINNKAEASNYIWESETIPLNRTWNNTYENPIYFANIVLDQLKIIGKKPGEDAMYNEIRGAALFFRSFNFFQLAQLYCKPYASDNANEAGIVLKLTSVVTAPSTRATIQETYDQIVADLDMAVALLPANTLFPTRPSRVAAHAALARVYLSMREYSKAAQHADLALQDKSTLLDYNTVSTLTTPFNTEVIFFSYSVNGSTLGRNRARIDSSLYSSYDPSDLRKKLFFIKHSGFTTYGFKGSYEGILNDRVFDGLTTDELYLIRAESNARAGNTNVAMDDLNTLLRMRWESGLFIDFTAADADEALEKILVERRKELVYRGLRWSDIRRLNLENRNITLKRDIGGVMYQLPPNDLRTVMLIPWDEVNRSKISQNPR